MHNGTDTDKISQSESLTVTRAKKDIRLLEREALYGPLDLHITWKINLTRHALSDVSLQRVQIAITVNVQ